MPGVAFVVNGSLVRSSGHLVALCRQEAKRHGWDAELRVTEKAEAGVSAASGAALDGADLVVAVGSLDEHGQNGKNDDHRPRLAQWSNRGPWLDDHPDGARLTGRPPMQQVSAPTSAIGNPTSVSRSIVSACFSPTRGRRLFFKLNRSASPGRSGIF